MQTPIKILSMKHFLFPLALIVAIPVTLLTGCSMASKRESTSQFQTLSGPVTFTVYATPASVGGTIPGCPGTYAGSVSYTKTIANGWGWVPDTNNTSVFTAADGGGRTNTKVVYLGKNLDSGCGTNSVTVPNPPGSAVYRFTIYFPNNVPGTNYPIVLTGFKP
jgi:hypothetical protein